MNYTPQKHLLILPLSLLLCLTFLISACASDPGNYQGSGGSTPTATTYPASGGSTPTSTGGSSSDSYVVSTASVSVKGTTRKVLTNAQGYTLYYFTPDTSTKSACTTSNGCASNWPPLLYTGTGTPTGNGLPGTLSVYANANGNQVLYQNHYLYTFAGDTAPGQANGQGIGGKWYVATPDLK